MLEPHPLRDEKWKERVDKIVGVILRQQSTIPVPENGAGNLSCDCRLPGFGLALLSPKRVKLFHLSRFGSLSSNASPCDP